MVRLLDAILKMVEGAIKIVCPLKFYTFLKLCINAGFIIFIFKVDFAFLICGLVNPNSLFFTSVINE